MGLSNKTAPYLFAWGKAMANNLCLVNKAVEEDTPSPDIWCKLKRALILGTEGTSVTGEFVPEAISNIVDKCIEADGPKTVDTIAKVSNYSYTTDNYPSLFALAKCSAHEDIATRKAVSSVFPKVVRTSSHLFYYISHADKMRGWGRSFRYMISNWYNNMPSVRLAKQILICPQKYNWNHKDVLRLAHPIAKDVAHNEIYKYVMKGITPVGLDISSEYIRAVEMAKMPIDQGNLISLITKYKLPAELVPENRRSPLVYAALIKTSSTRWILDNLCTIASNVDLTTSQDTVGNIIRAIDRIKDSNYNSISPVLLLSTYVKYREGQTTDNSRFIQWKPVQEIEDKLINTARKFNIFASSLNMIEPSGKNVLAVIDISDYSLYTAVQKFPNLSTVSVGSLMALIHTHTDPNTAIMPMENLGDKPRQSAKDYTIPIEWAYNNKKYINTFIIYTACTDISKIKKEMYEALLEYREDFVHDAQLLVVSLAKSRDEENQNYHDDRVLSILEFNDSTIQTITNFLLDRV